MNDYVPSEFYLGQNYPDPFKKRTTIKYCIAYKTKVRITVFNSEGNMIEKLVDDIKEAGTYEIEFSVSDQEKDDNQVSGIKHREPSIQYLESGIRRLASGKYFYQMKAGNYLSEKEMTFLKEANKSVQT